MAAIPIYIYDRGFVEEKQGALLKPPAELLSKSQQSFYSQCKPGWQRCPLGYQVYCAIDELGRKLVIPGIFVPNETAPKRKFPNYPLKFSKAEIEEFAKSHLNIASNVREQRDTEFKNLTHDLRLISTEIYHNALDLRERISNYAGRDEDKAQIELIINAQQMMSMRLDIIDYDNGLSSTRPKENISPYRKVDKVVRCFNGKLQAKKMNCSIEGRNNEFIFGPPIFEIVPFVIMENALKYAPYNSEVVVRFQEEHRKCIIRFDSYGPRISQKEKNRIFERDYRGEAAQQLGRSGSGIGLFAAKTIVENHFDGKIFVNQLEPRYLIGGQEYWSTRFTIIVPTQESETMRR